MVLLEDFHIPKHILSLTTHFQSLLFHLYAYILHFIYYLHTFVSVTYSLLYQAHESFQKCIIYWWIRRSDSWIGPSVCYAGRWIGFPTKWPNSEQRHLQEVGHISTNVSSIIFKIAHRESNFSLYFTLRALYSTWCTRMACSFAHIHILSSPLLLWLCVG